jgi:hypothetical protein
MAIWSFGVGRKRHRGQSLVDNPLNATVSSIAAAGPTTWTGTAPDETFAFYMPIMLGKFAEPGRLV